MDLGLTGVDAVVAGGDDAVGSAVRRTLQTEGATIVDAGAARLDALVHTGVSLEESDADWPALLESQLVDPARATRSAAAAMTDGGSIVNIVSIDAWKPDPARVGRGVVGAALRNVGTAMAKEFGGRGVRVNTVAIGPDTPPDEVATVVAFLVSRRSANITGATLTIDGGATATI